jgi:hypothetical protein
VFIKSWKRKKVDPSVPGENEKSSKSYVPNVPSFIYTTKLSEVDGNGNP